MHFPGRHILYLTRRFLASFWAMPLAVMVAALGLLGLFLSIDMSGGSVWAAAQPFPINLTGPTVEETVATINTVLIGLFTLFFSITLIVLTMASSSLGVRLIDRWIDNTVIKVTLSILLGLLVYAFLLQAAIDPDGPDAEIPRLSTLALLIMVVALGGWLSVAFHHLSRRIHVDTSIVSLAEDLKKNFSLMDDLVEAHSLPSWEAHGIEVRAKTSGYIEDIDYPGLARFARDKDLTVILSRRTGSFVLEGDRLALLSREVEDERALHRAYTIGGFRTNGQGARFQIMLLAEIAARALSPAVNDLYTAMTCIDHIVAGCAPVFASRKIGRGWISDRDGTPRLYPDFDTVIPVIEKPMDVIRHAAKDYPSVSQHLIEMTARLYHAAALPDDKAWLRAYANSVHEGARKAATVQADRDALDAALESFEEHG